MPKISFKDYNLYFVMSQEYAPGRNPLEVATLAIKGGIDILQMREKNMPRKDLICLGNKLSKLCKSNNVTFIINDNPYLLEDVQADGVHMGQGDIADLPISKVRKIIGPEKIIGVSTHSLSEFFKANEEDVDYIAFGPIFPTQTKDYFIGIQDVEEVLRSAKKDVFLIGGINLSNIDEILRLGAKKIALIRGIVQAEDILAQAKEFKQRIETFDKEIVRNEP